MSIHWLQVLVGFLLGTFFGGMILSSVTGLFGGGRGKTNPTG